MFEDFEVISSPKSGWAHLPIGRIFPDFLTWRGAQELALAELAAEFPFLCACKSGLHSLVESIGKLQPQPSAPTKAVAANPERWVDDHGDCLYRYALARVRRPELAEDLVQETLLAAVRSLQRFAGYSSERSWLVGILKNKIVDYYRKLGRETSFTDLEFLKDECSHKFVEGGFWNHDLGPHEWRPAALEVMHKGEFWQTLRDCLAKLPPRVADVFMLREMEDLTSKEICNLLGVTESNLWVMLHRARMALRECLEIHWFDQVNARKEP